MGDSAHAATSRGGTAPGLRAPDDGQIAASARSSHAAWWIGGALLAAVLVLAIPYWFTWRDVGGGSRMPMPGVGAPGIGVAPNVDLANMTEREAADRLFNRVMRAIEAGDIAEARTFVQMGIDAYRLVPGLDADGHFHLSLLQQVAGDHAGGLASAERVLADDPNHLLALHAAGEAAAALGDTERALAYFRRFLDAYETERARDIPEYREHAEFLPSAREAARAYVAAGGG